MAVDLKKYRKQFVPHARKQLHELEKYLGSPQADVQKGIEKAYRCFHTIHGTAGMLQLASLRACVGPLAERLRKLSSQPPVDFDEIVNEIRATTEKVLEILDEISVSDGEG